ncbi:retrovirus-related pol polyprotein from transposon TNT 1-94 [Tanacetum coccineum]
MTGDRSRLRNFVKKFIGTVRFGNDHFGAIMCYGDYVIGDSVISKVYYVEGLGHNLFSVGQFCDSDLEAAFRKHTCYVRDTDGVELIKGSRGLNLYTILVKDMMKSSPICLLSKASKNKSWLWHRRLNHLNFGTINDLARKDLVRGLPRLKFEKDHLFSACQLGKSTKHTHKPKPENTNLEVLNTLHMDLCGPMRVQTINGKKYILVIVDDYSRFTWVKFLRSKDETPAVVIKFLKQIQVGLNKTTVPRTPQQNGVVERRNCTLVEAARTMLIFSKAPIFLWAEAVATAFFGALCYPTNDSEDLGKLQPTTDIRIFVGYAPSRKGYRIYNKRTRRIMKTIHVQFDELTEHMAPVQIGIGPAPTFLTPRCEILFQPMFDEYLEPPRVERPVSPAPAVQVPVWVQSRRQLVAEERKCLVMDSEKNERYNKPVRRRILFEWRCFLLDIVPKEMVTYLRTNHRKVSSCLKGGSENSGGKRLAISMVEEAWLSEKKEVYERAASCYSDKKNESSRTLEYD